VLQVGLQRRYSKMYQMAKQIVDKGPHLATSRTFIAQWHRNPGWIMKGRCIEGGQVTRQNWRMYREFSGGAWLLKSPRHQTDVADYIFWR